MFTPVLVLNQDFSILALARVPRALALLDRAKAELLAQGVFPIQTSNCTVPRPAVIRLMHYVKRPRPHVRFARQNVFKRDGFACQYCGIRPKDLTIDHVIPRHRGGQDTWGNTVACCRKCNQHKGGRTPEEAGMVLKKKPFEPRLDNYLHIMLGNDHRPEWAPFLPQ